MVIACTSAETILEVGTCFSWLLLQSECWQDLAIDCKREKKALLWKGLCHFSICTDICSASTIIIIIITKMCFQETPYIVDKQDAFLPVFRVNNHIVTKKLSKQDSNGTEAMYRLCIVLCPRTSIVNGVQVPEWKVRIYGNYWCSFCLHLLVWF